MFICLTLGTVVYTRRKKRANISKQVRSSLDPIFSKLSRIASPKRKSSAKIRTVRSGFSSKHGKLSRASYRVKSSRLSRRDTVRTNLSKKRIL